MTDLVAYQGIAGAFGEEAVHRLWRGSGVPVPAATFAAALDAVQRGAVGWAVIPVWNAIVGPIHSACIELHRRRHTIETKQYVDVDVGLCLLALPGAHLHDIRHVASHPAALGQCGQFFRGHPRVTACVAADTASAAFDIAEFARGFVASGDSWLDAIKIESPHSLAALASRRAANEYGLSILAENVQDIQMNFTRFAAVRRRGQRSGTCRPARHDPGD